MSTESSNSSKDNTDDDTSPSEKTTTDSLFQSILPLRTTDDEEEGATASEAETSSADPPKKDRYAHLAAAREKARAVRAAQAAAAREAKERAALGIDASGDDDEEEIDNAVSPPRAEKQKKETKIVAKEKREPGPAPLEEIPREELFELEALGHTEVLLSLHRKLQSGNAAVKANIRLPIRALFDMQSAITSYAGGGKFLFTITDVETRKPLCSKWYETYEGPPRLPPNNTHTLVWDEQNSRVVMTSIAAAMGADVGATSMGQALTGLGPQPMPYAGSTPGVPTAQPPQALTPEDLRALAAQQVPRPQRDSLGNLLPPPPGQLPKWAVSGGFTPEQQWDMILNVRMEELKKTQLEQGGAAVGLAGQWIHHEIRRQGDLSSEKASLQTELRQIQQTLQQRIDSVSKEAQARIESANEARARAEREVERIKAEAEMKRIEAKFEAMQIVNAAPKGPDFAAIVSSLGALVPVVTAYIQNSAENARAERDAQMKILLATLNKKEDNGGLDMMKTVLPLAAPLLAEWFKNNGPQAQAEVLALEHEQRMMSVKMMADLIQGMTPDTPQAEWWKPLLEMAANGIMTLGQRQQMQALPKPQPTNVLPAAPNGVPPAERAQQQVPLIDQMASQDPQAAQMVRAIYAQLPQDLGFHTHEWMTIIFHVHAKQVPEEIVPIIVNHLANCKTFNLLPTPLHDVFENPQEALMRVFGPLPVSAQDPAYVEQIVQAVVDEIAEMTADEDEGGEDEADESPETEPKAEIVEDAGAIARNRAAGIRRGTAKSDPKTRLARSRTHHVIPDPVQDKTPDDVAATPTGT